MSELPEGQQTLAGVAGPPPAPPPAVSPGRRLREAREASGLSIADVTQAIKFSARQIEAIEADDYAKLPGSTFARGVIRSYAKMLRLEEKPLLAMLAQQKLVADSEVRAPQDTGAELPLPGEWRSRVPLLTVVIVLAAIAIAAASYFRWPGSAEKHNLVQAKPNAAQVAPPPARVGPSAEAVSAPPAKMSDAPPVAPDTRQLVFVFADKSWVEVKDATQKVIFAQNNPADTRQVVNGQPPFDLVIGNAAHVQLQYGDKPIDLRPYTKVEVARLRLE